MLLGVQMMGDIGAGEAYRRMMRDVVKSSQSLQEASSRHGETWQAQTVFRFGYIVVLWATALVLHLIAWWIRG